jgi:hypothetical protein
MRVWTHAETRDHVLCSDSVVLSCTYSIHGLLADWCASCWCVWVAIILLCLTTPCCAITYLSHCTIHIRLSLVGICLVYSPVLTSQLWFIWHDLTQSLVSSKYCCCTFSAPVNTCSHYTRSYPAYELTTSNIWLVDVIPLGYLHMMLWHVHWCRSGASRRSSQLASTAPHHCLLISEW